jgi:hypothetical protein
MRPSVALAIEPVSAFRLYRVLVLGLLTCLLAAAWGCKAGRLGEVPAGAAGGGTAEVFVIRPSGLVGKPVSFAVAVDEKDVFAIRSGQYTSFPVPAGDRYISVRCLSDLLGMKRRHALPVALEAGKTYYFLTEPASAPFCAMLRVVEEQDARKLLEANTHVPFE